MRLNTSMSTVVENALFHIVNTCCNVSQVYKLNFFFIEIGNLALIRWFAPEGKKPSHFPSKSSFPFFGVELVLVEERPSLMVSCSLNHIRCSWIAQ